MESYEIEQKLKNFRPEPNWDRFKTLKPRSGVTRAPLVSITTTTVAFNQRIIKDKMIFDNVELMTTPNNEVLFLFKQKADANTYRVYNGKSQSHISSTKIAKRIAEMADLHIKLYHYKFKPTYYDSKQHRIVIDLKEPYSKSRIKNKQK